MPRKPRVISSTGIYHVILRSVNQQIIFEEDFDFQKFLLILSDCKAKYNVDIYAYCLMNNHIHLLLHSGSESLASFFKSLESRFARWYNEKYDRYGYLFQERYHSKTVENAEYYLTTLAYINYNPVKAGICQYASEYRWSSYNAFYGENNPLIDIAFSYSIVGSKASLLSFFSSYANSHYFNSDTTEYEYSHVSHHITDEQALQKFFLISGLPTNYDVSKLTRTARNNLIEKLIQNGMTRKQISRLTGYSVSTIYRICVLRHLSAPEEN